MSPARPSLESRLTALLLDAHELRRLGLRTLLEEQRAVTVVGEAGTIADAIEQALHTCPTVIVTAPALPDGDAAEACRRLADKAPGTRVAVLSEIPVEAAMAGAVRVGASGGLSTHMRGAELCRAIRAIATGESQLDPRSAHALFHRLRRDGGPRDHLFTLTPQERRVLALVADGKTNKEIGAALGLSEKTVKNYLSHAFEKLQVSRRAQAAVLFVRDRGGAALTPSTPAASHGTARVA